MQSPSKVQFFSTKILPKIELKKLWSQAPTRSRLTEIKVELEIKYYF